MNLDVNRMFATNIPIAVPLGPIDGVSHQATKAPMKTP